MRYFLFFTFVCGLYAQAPQPSPTIIGSSATPSGACGGDLGGTFPNCTVVGSHLASPLPQAQGGLATANIAFTAPTNTATYTPANNSTFVTAGQGLASGTYTSGITATGTIGQTCALTVFNNGNTGGTATVALTGTNTIAGGTALVITAAGSGNTSASTSATAGNGSATCSGTATVVTVLTGFSLTLTATGLTNFTVPVGTTTGAISGVDINTAGQVTATHLAAALPVLQGGTGLTAGSANKVLGGATPSYVTVTSAYVDNSIALTGTDINTSNQVTVTHLAAALPVAQGGTNCTSATVTCFNNITGFSAAGTTGTTSTNLVFSTSPTVTTPVFSGLTTVNGAGATSGTNALVITNSTPINTFVVRNDGLVTIQAGGTGADGVNTAPLRFITANSASDTADFVFSRAGNPHFYIVGSAVPWLGVGGDSSSFPALGRSGTALQAVLANDGSTLTSMNFSTISIANSSFSFNGHTCTIVSTVVTCP